MKSKRGSGQLYEPGDGVSAGDGQEKGKSVGGDGQVKGEVVGGDGQDKEESVGGDGEDKGEVVGGDGGLGGTPQGAGDGLDAGVVEEGKAGPGGRGANAAEIGLGRRVVRGAGVEDGRQPEGLEASEDRVIHNGSAGAFAAAEDGHYEEDSDEDNDDLATGR